MFGLADAAAGGACPCWGRLFLLEAAGRRWERWVNFAIGGKGGNGLAMIIRE